MPPRCPDNVETGIAPVPDSPRTTGFFPFHADALDKSRIPYYIDKTFYQRSVCDRISVSDRMMYGDDP
jgi:hypothetical protein